MEQGKVFIFSAPSGAGKTTIVREILKRQPSFEFSISATTRKARPYEVNGIHYFFLSVDSFREKADAGEFLEWEEVYEGLFYGTLKSEVDRILMNQKHVVFDVDVQGGLNIKKHYGDHAVAFFISPPSEETLRTRLIDRGSDSMEAIEFRCAKASQEMQFAPDFDHVIVNDVLETAIAEAMEIIESKLQIA